MDLYIPYPMSIAPAPKQRPIIRPSVPEAFTQTFTGPVETHPVIIVLVLNVLGYSNAFYDLTSQFVEAKQTIILTVYISY
jgi:hypothetical protein